MWRTEISERGWRYLAAVLGLAFIVLLVFLFWG